MKTKTTRQIPNFKVSHFEGEIINRIANRAVKMAMKHGILYDKISADMDLRACHNSCPLDLSKLETAPDADFGHDAFGIRRHINRDTGELENCFLPRCAMPERVATPASI